MGVGEMNKDLSKEIIEFQNRICKNKSIDDLLTIAGTLSSESVFIFKRILGAKGTVMFLYQQADKIVVEEKT